MIVVDKNGTPYRLSTGETVDFDVLAKALKNRFMIMVSNEGELFNPMDYRHDLRDKDNKRGRSLWNLKKCSRECYYKYVEFLRSKNKTPYLVARRRFQNDF